MLKYLWILAGKKGEEDKPGTAAPVPGTGKAVDFAKISIEEAFETLKVGFEVLTHGLTCFSSGALQQPHPLMRLPALTAQLTIRSSHVVGLH